MSSVNVKYNFRTVKAPVTPSTQLSQVRDFACARFNLPAENYGLTRQGKQIDLFIPFRFANLVNNAQLDLAPAPKAAADQTIRVKIRISGGKDYISSFGAKTKAGEMLHSAGLSGKLRMGPTLVNLDSTLASLGGAGGLLFALEPGSTATPVASGSKNSVDLNEKSSISPPRENAVPDSTRGSSTSTLNDTNTGVESNKKPFDKRQTEVTTVNYSQKIPVDDTNEMTKSQFLTYYNHLKSQAEPPMVSKSTREKLRQDTRPVTTTIKIRFPDQSTLSGKFEAGETGAAVYQYVKSYLRKPSTEFTLDSINPRFTLEENANLVTKLGSRALLVFTSLSQHQQNAAYLNDHALTFVKKIEPYSEVPQGLQQQQSQQSQVPQSVGDPQEHKQEKRKMKGVPKWLKLHK